MIADVEGGSSGPNVLVLASASVAVLGYLAVWLRHPLRPRLRLACWLAGVGALVAASSPWMESLAAESFSGHMVQHLIIIAVAAPLLVLGEPVRVTGRTIHLPTSPRLRRVGAWWRRLAVVISPALFVVVLFTTHLTTWYDESLHHPLLHEAEHAAYLFGATMTWAAVRGVGRTGAPARLGAVFGVSAAGALLGMILMSASDPLMPTYEASLGTARALSDQRAAASIMWVGGMLATLPLLLLAGWRWAAAEERIALRTEALTDRPTDPAHTTFMSRE
ncbi:MAG: cytochrome c oxidase assembly protein [Actinomycetota bacterium]|nr:cytochrome c oxidase assembly protein [Actinomycetota bacterium]